MKTNFLIATLFLAASANAQIAQIAPDLSPYNGEFKREVVEKKGGGKSAQIVKLSYTQDASGLQELTFEWQGSSAAPYRETFQSNPRTGFFFSSEVSGTGGHCNSDHAAKVKVTSKSAYLKCAEYSNGGKPYTATLFTVVDADTFKATVSQSRCLINAGGHVGCLRYGGMKEAWSTTFSRVKIY